VRGLCVKAYNTQVEVAGKHFKEWDTKDNNGYKLIGGNYFYIIMVDGKRCMGKLIVGPE
jgi:flagellar hook assembly protein FlgD